MAFNNTKPNSHSFVLSKSALLLSSLADFVSKHSGVGIALLFISGAGLLWIGSDTPNVFPPSVTNTNITRLESRRESLLLAKTYPWEFLDACKTSIIRNTWDAGIKGEYFTRNSRSIDSYCVAQLSDLRHGEQPGIWQFIMKQYESAEFAPSAVERFFRILAIVALVYFYTMYPAAYIRTNKKQFFDHIPVDTNSFMLFGIGSILGSMSGFYQGSTTAGTGYAILAIFGLFTAFYNEFGLKPSLKSGKVVANIPWLADREEIFGRHTAYISFNAHGNLVTISPKFTALLGGKRLSDIPVIEKAVLKWVEETLSKKSIPTKSLEFSIGHTKQTIELEFDPIKWMDDRITGVFVIAELL